LGCLSEVSPSQVWRPSTNSAAFSHTQAVAPCIAQPARRQLLCSNFGRLHVAHEGGQLPGRLPAQTPVHQQAAQALQPGSRSRVGWVVDESRDGAPAMRSDRRPCRPGVQAWCAAERAAAAAAAATAHRPPHATQSATHLSAVHRVQAQAVVGQDLRHPLRVGGHAAQEALALVGHRLRSSST